MNDAKNYFDDITIDEKSFSLRDLLGIDRWDSFVVTASLTVVGTPAYVGRYRFDGKKCEFQISAVASTSIASTAGTHYFQLPTAGKGIGGQATMTNATTKIAVGNCHIDNSVVPARAYLPAQAASGDVFHICGSYEIG